MQNIRSLQFHAGSREELLPGFSPDFPYISSRAEIHRYEERFVPWHWHAAVELFYLERGALEYRTTGQRILFPEGSAGFVNSGILHMTRPVSDRGDAPGEMTAQVSFTLPLVDTMRFHRRADA